MKKILTLLIVLALCLTAFIACNKDEAPSIEEAGTYLFNLYKDDSTVTNSDYDVAGQVILNGTDKFTVEWTVDDTANVTIRESSKSGFYTIDINEKTPTEVTYTLTATIKGADGKTVTKTFTRTIPAYKLFSYAEYAAAADDDAIVVEGVVIGIVAKSTGSSANSLYLQDANNDGGYYVYNLTEDPITDLGIKVGMTVNVSGVKDTYNGLYEIVNATATITDSTVKAVEPVDFTEIYKSAEALTDASLVSKQSMLVTVKGVEITTQDDSNGYYKFKLGDKETYVRISSSNNCLTKDEITSIKQGHSEHAVWTANVTGIVQLYSGAFYLIPADADAFEYLSEITKTDAEKIEIEKGNLDILANATEDTELTLPLTGSKYSDVKFTWTVSTSNAAVYNAATGKLTITLPDAAEKLTLTAAITCGSASETATFEIAVDAKSTAVYVPEFATEPKVVTPFKLCMYQAILGENLYFTGSTVPDKDYYLATSNKGEKAVDVYLEAVDGVTGGYRIYFTSEEGVKTYIELYEREAGKGSIRLVTSVPESYFTYSTDFNTFVFTAGSNSYYMGTYKEFNTVSASNTSYINSENVNVSQFPLRLCTLAEAKPTAVKATPAVDTAFKLQINQVNLSKELYFTGSTVPDKDYYLATSDKVDKAADVYLEAVDGVADGYRMYFTAEGGVKTYIEIYERTDAAGKASIRLVTTTPENYFTYNTDFDTFVFTAGSNSYYMGSYNTYDNISASNTSYISKENAGVSQFPASIVTITYTK